MGNCIPLVFLSVLCLSITAKTHVQSSLYRDYKTKHGKFKSNQNQSLLVTLTKSHFLEDALECSFHCIGDSKCLSYNIAKSPDSNGIYICEVLATDKYRAKDRLQANSSFHHFSPMSPCESLPCQNSGTCIPDYEENSYSCSCPSHVTGQHCETLPSHVVSWLHFTPQWCTGAGRSTRLANGITADECKEMCAENCLGMEWWEGSMSCFECTDPSKKTSYTNTNDGGYPPHVFLKS